MDNKMLVTPQIKVEELDMNQHNHHHQTMDHHQHHQLENTQTPSPHEASPTNHQSNNSSPTSGTNSQTKNKKLFPQKLWELINDDKYSFCLRWSDDGQLVYLNRDDFEDSYLKKPENQFHTQKAISFVRQMNMYGFRKVDDCYYENDNFKRDCDYLLKNMIRKHPNKINPTNLTPNMYRTRNQMSSSSVANSDLLQSSAATAASLLAPNHHHHNNFNQHLNVGNFLDFRQRLNQYQMYNSNRSELPLNSGNKSDKSVIKTNNMDSLYHQLHLQQQHQQQEHSLEEEKSTDDSLSSVGDYCCNSNLLLSNQDTTNGTDLSTMNQRHNFQPLYSDQKELIKALIAQQQSDTQYPRDLTTASSKSNNNQQNHILQSDNSTSLNALYALLSSLNSNLYQPVTQMQAHQNFDINGYLQNIYQQMLSTSTPATSPSATATPTAPSTNARLDQSTTLSAPLNYESYSTMINQNSLAQAQQLSAPTGTRMEDLALHTPASDKESSSTSLLARNKFSTTTTKSNKSLEMFENGYKNSCQTGERSHERARDNKQRQQNDNYPLGKSISDSESPVTKRRDTKTSTTNRSFKRSIDSILDSNNNNSNASLQHRPSVVNKRIKIDSNSDESIGDRVFENEAVNEYAMYLVAQVALSKQASIDPNVISEVSRLTQRFVETLFDTAQVIARHSNSSSLSADIAVSNATCPSSLREEADIKPGRDNERSINLNDLASALKLLPSKISKLLR